MVVRVHERVLAARAAEDLRGAIGEHLVGVHVVRRARARLVDVDDELIAKRSGKDFVGRANNRVADLPVKAPERGVCLCGGLLDQDGGGDEIGGCAQAADREVLERPHRLDAVVGVGGNGVLTERVALGSEVHLNH